MPQSREGISQQGYQGEENNIRNIDCKNYSLCLDEAAHKNFTMGCKNCKDMSNFLKPEKEKEVKALLKTHSQREIVKLTGVAKNTITRIRNENLTEEEKADFKKQANIRGRNKKGLQKVGEIIPKIIPSEPKLCLKCLKDKPISEFTANSRMPDGFHNHCRECKTAGQRARTNSKWIQTKQPEVNIPEKWGSLDVAVVPKKEESYEEIIASANRAVIKIDVIETMLQEKEPKWNFDDIAKKQQELLEQRKIEVEAGIKKLMAEHTRIMWRIYGLSEYFSITDTVDTETDEYMETEYIETKIDDWNEKIIKKES